jgi:hypothetical protein
VQLQGRVAPSTMQQQRDTTAPRQDSPEPSSAQQRHELTALDEPVAYRPRLDVRKPCRGNKMSGLLTTRSAETGKWISDEEKYDGDDDLGAVQAGP